MRKVTLSLAICVGMFFYANAQKIQIGPKAGVNFSSVTNIANSDAHIGFHAGVFARFGAKALTIQPEVIYSSQGVKISDVDTKLDYIHVPIMLQYKLYKSFYIEAGPQFGFLTQGTEPLDERFKNSDLSINAGLGFKLPSIPFGAYLRYSFGVTNNNEENPVATGKMLNNLAQIGISFNFISL